MIRRRKSTIILLSSFSSLKPNFYRKGQVKKKKQELKSKYEDEEVPVRSARRGGASPSFSTEVEDEETPGAPLPRKPAAKPSSRPVIPKPSVPATTAAPKAAAKPAAAATQKATPAPAGVIAYDPSSFFLPHGHFCVLCLP